MELKNCPFCGEAKNLHIPDVEPDTLYRVSCNNCSAQGEYHAIRDEAISAWNQRHSAVKVATVDLKPLHDLAEKWKYLWYDLSGDSGGYGECAKELRKALKQMEEA